MRYIIKVKFTNDILKYQDTRRVVYEDDLEVNNRVLNSMLASGEITSYEVSMEGH